MYKRQDIDNPRLYNLKEKTLRFRFKVVHVPGRKQCGPDATSRHPVGAADRLNLEDDQPEQTAVHLSSEDNYQDDILASIRQQEVIPSLDCHDDTDLGLPPAAVFFTNEVHSVTWDMIREATASDPTMRGLVTQIENGFPSSRDNVPASLHLFYQFRESLSVVDGVVMYLSLIHI